MSQNAPTFSIRRDDDDKFLGGVCSSVSSRLGVDPNVTRIAAVTVACLTGGTAVAAYGAAWMLIPREGETSSIAQKLINKATDGDTLKR
jgi:phage shock protein PspC (stress-responsive transcriptional regulator)